METKVLKKAEKITDEKGNNFVISRQSITLDNGEQPEFIVLEKYKTSTTGAPRGKQSMLWVPVSCVPSVLDAVKNLSK